MTEYYCYNKKCEYHKEIEPVEGSRRSPVIFTKVDKRGDRNYVHRFWWGKEYLCAECSSMVSAVTGMGPLGEFRLKGG